jgi:hypothetical protein
VVFAGEKTSLYWVGVVMLSSASVALFAVVWSILTYLYSPYSSGIPFYAVSDAVPELVGAVVFILVGFYMMKSGVKKPMPAQPTPAQEFRSD